MTIRKVKDIIFYCCVAIAFSIITYARFSNPDYTETELFLNCWKEHLLAVIICMAGCGALFFNGGDK